MNRTHIANLTTGQPLVVEDDFKLSQNELDRVLQNGFQPRSFTMQYNYRRNRLELHLMDKTGHERLAAVRHVSRGVGWRMINDPVGLNDVRERIYQRELHGIEPDMKHEHVEQLVGYEGEELDGDETEPDGDDGDETDLDEDAADLRQITKRVNDMEVEE